MGRRKIAPKKMKKERGGKKRCHVEKALFSDAFNLSRETPISDKEIENVRNVKGVDDACRRGKYTVHVDVASVYDKDDVIKRVKKVLGCE